MGSAKKAVASLFLIAVAGIAFSQALLSSPIEVRRADGSAVRYYLEAEDPPGPLGHPSGLGLH